MKHRWLVVFYDGTDITACVVSQEVVKVGSEYIVPSDEQLKQCISPDDPDININCKYLMDSPGLVFVDDREIELREFSL
jgi:hypothetical protein